MLTLVLALVLADAPAATVEAVYKGHFAHQQRFEDTVKRERARFSRELLALLEADAKAAAANPDEVVGLDYDPLTNAQEEADSYQVGREAIAGQQATVPVEIRFGRDRAALTVHLVEEGGAWRIADLRNAEGGLVATLRQLARERQAR